MACLLHHSLILPADNSQEAAMVEDVAVYRPHTPPEAIAFTKGLTGIEPTRNNRGDLFRTRPTEEDDYGDVNGQEHAKRPLEAAAASGHNILMVGPPGSRKTMLAKRLPPILPLMKSHEGLETTRVPSVARYLPTGHSSPCAHFGLLITAFQTPDSLEEERSHVSERSLWLITASCSWVNLQSSGGQYGIGSGNFLKTAMSS